MRAPDRLQHVVAAVAVAAGAGTFAFALGGLADVDADLRAAAPAQVESRFVSDRGDGGDGWDCPEAGRHAPHPASASDVPAEL